MMMDDRVERKKATEEKSLGEGGTLERGENLVHVHSNFLQRDGI